MKKLLLYILTLSMLLGVFNFGVVTITAQLSAPSTTVPAGYTGIANETQFRAMTAGGKYCLTADVSLDQGPYQFPANVTLIGNGHAILPPTGTGRSNYLKSSDSNQLHYETSSSYITHCFFWFTKSDLVTFENVSFGSTERPFCMLDDANPDGGSGTALFSTTWGVKELVCTNVDFHTYIKEPNGNQAGNAAGFMSVVFNTVTMTNCNIMAFIDAETSSQAGGFFAQTSNGTGTTLTMTNCTVLPGSHVKKRAQTAGFVGQLSGTAVFTNCTNYADLEQTGGEHAGGIVANFNENGVKVTFTKCANYGTIWCLYTGGGICGTLAGSTSYKTKENPIEVTFTDCLNAGDVGPRPAATDANGNVTTYYGERVGGLLGRIEGKIKVTFQNCVNVGVIHGPEKLTSEINGYFFDSVGQFIGGIHQVSQAKDAETGEYSPRPGNGNADTNSDGVGDGHPYYSIEKDRSDEGWTWHYIYDSVPVLFLNCYAYGNIVLPSHAKELDTTDGTDAEVSDSNTEVNLSVGDIAHHGFAGTPVLIDPASKTDSPCNWQIRQNNGAESHWYETGVGRLGTVDTNEAGLTKLNAWLAAQGIKEVYMLDNSRTAKNESTFPYLIGTPRIYAYLCDSEHKNIRIVGTLNSAKYKKVGFNYNVKVNGVAEIHATDHWTTTAYTDVGLKTANQLNGEYLYEMTLLNVPTDKTVVVSIVPKALAISGQEYVGQRYNLTFTNGKFTKCQITNP